MQQDISTISTNSQWVIEDMVGESQVHIEHSDLLKTKLEEFLAQLTLVNKK